MKKTFFLSFLAAAGLGTAGHFLYALWPNALTALIAPVNEGVWEHLKLLYFPPLLVFLILSLRTAKPRRDFWSGALYGVLLGPVLLTAAFYTLTAGFGVRAGPAFDIPLYYVCLAAAWICAFGRIESGGAARFLGALAGRGVCGVHRRRAAAADLSARIIRIKRKKKRQITVDKREKPCYYNADKKEGTAAPHLTTRSKRSTCKISQGESLCAGAAVHPLFIFIGGASPSLN